MQIKSRTIRMGSEGHGVLIDEYAIADSAVFHRSIVIGRDVYGAFQKDPDHTIHLDAFLKQHAIEAEWSRVTTDDLDRLPKWLQETGDGEESKTQAYKWVYKTLSDKETLITDPLMLDVFNEALRDDTDLTDWESVFPFFR